jgi:hypothetical protein
MSCNIIENVDLSRHALCMKTPIVCHVCHMTKLVMNKKKFIKTCVAIWILYHANYVPYITVKLDSKLFGKEMRSLVVLVHANKVIYGNVQFTSWHEVTTKY